uniref:Uncharacterized protein n=1 Tax=Arundo donax TaxID=35708 RepID=A0A0A9GXM2_ARUDO
MLHFARFKSFCVLVKMAGLGDK